MNEKDVEQIRDEMLELINDIETYDTIMGDYGVELCISKSELEDILSDYFDNLNDKIRQ